MRQKPRVCHSTGQGVAGNGESEGPRGKRPDPSESEQTTSAVIEERPTPILGKPFVVSNGGVRDAGMGALGSQGDPGKPSVCPPRVEEGVSSERSEVAKARDSEAVSKLKEVSREDQGGRWSRSTDGASCNGRSGKGSWSTEEDRRRLVDDVRKKRDAWWEEPRPPSAQSGQRTEGSGDPLGRSVSLGRTGTQDPTLRTGRDSVARETRPLRWGWRTAGRKPRLRPYPNSYEISCRDERHDPLHRRQALPHFQLPASLVFRPPRVTISRAGCSSLTVASMVATREGRKSEMKMAGGLLSGTVSPDSLTR